MEETTILTIAEMPGYLRSLQGVLTEKENDELKGHIARYPDAGSIIGGTGGVRKVRWATGGKGKSGAARIIYYKRSQYYLCAAYFETLAFARSSATRLLEPDSLRKVPKEPVSKGRAFARSSNLRPLLKRQYRDKRKS